ncbi:MAG: 4Fe-4S dicluster domain-containing protein [Candidatus Eisenbacteria bacterium]
MAENSFYYDGSLCIACRSCQVACKQWNYLEGEKTTFFAAAGGYQNPSQLSPTTWTIVKFHEVQDGNRVGWLFRRHHCFHCAQAACIEVCPVEPKAMKRHAEYGTVYVDQDLCIGCGSCVEACPFGVPHVNEKLEKSRKCTACFDRVGNDLLTACAKTCPTQSIRYGPKQEMYALAGKRVKELEAAGWKNANIYGPDQLGGLHSIYVLLDKPEVYGLVVDPKIDLGKLEPIRRRGEERYAARRQKGEECVASLILGSPPILAIGALALGVKRLGERKAEVSRKESER